jgi:hypothetical protein
MAYTVGNAASALYSAAGKAVADSNLPTGMAAAVAACINETMEEVRSVNPSVFRVPLEILLNAPSTGTFTLDGDLLNFTAGTLVVPNAGCTMLIDGTSYHNHIAAPNSAKWTLTRRAEIAAGAGTGTVWHDVWNPADGTTYERILGEVWLNNRWPVIVVADRNELTNLRVRRDFGQTFAGYMAPFASSMIQACWLDNSATDPTKPPEGRIHFWPMPAGQQLISMTAVRRFTDVTTTDVTTGTLAIGIPGGKEYLIFEPMLMKHWMRRPYFKPDGIQARAINEDYAKAIDRLEVYSPLLARQPIRSP